MGRSVECPRCNIGWALDANTPPVCPNCGQPWGPEKPIVHCANGDTSHALGWIAWCSCGVGSPPKASAVEARASLEEHLANPSEFPR